MRAIPFTEEDKDEIFAPEFIVKPRTVNIDESYRAVFVCRVFGKPEPRVQWRKDGTEIHDNSKYKV